MKKSNWVLPVLCALLLAGCSLARAEAAPEGGDRWVGFCVVPTQGYEDVFYGNPYLEEYGAQSLETEEFGTLSFPREVLFAVEDEAGNLVFPGIGTAFNLFFIETENEGGPCTKVVSNMGAHENGAAFSYKDEGKSVTLGGTVYYGPPLGEKDWDPNEDGTIWHFYRVYQTEDGRAYLDGGGDSCNGPMSHTSTQTYTGRTNGEIDREDAVSVTVSVETVPRLEKLVVTQFDADSAVVRAEDMALREELPEVRCEPGAAWVLVEEFSAEGVKRTVHNVPEPGGDPVAHDLVLLDGAGIGTLETLTIRA